MTPADAMTQVDVTGLRQAAQAALREMCAQTSAWRPDPTAARDAFRQLATATRVTALCDLVDALTARRDELHVRNVELLSENTTLRELMKARL